MSTCLHFAVDKAEMLKDDERQTKLKEFLHNQGLRPELKNHKGQTPLHIAALKGNLEGVKFLLKNFDIDVDEVDSSKRTASHLAAFSGNELVLNELVYSRAHITKLDQRSRSPLVYAVMSGKKQMVEVFFKRNLFYKLYSFNRQTILHVAAANGQTALLDYLLSKKLKVDARNNIGETPLLEAAFYGHLKAVKTLIRHGADVNSRNNNGDCALHIACSINMKEMVEELMKHKAEVDITDINDYAPIHIAAKNGFTSILIILLANNANINLPPYGYGSTALHYAVAGQHLEVVQTLLMQKGIEVNRTNKRTMTPLHIAASNGNTEILTLLVMHGADILCMDTNFLNPLALAAKYGHEAIVNILMDIPRMYPKTRIIISAVQSGNVNIIKKCLNIFNVNLTTLNGLNHLHLAIINQREIVDMLLLEGVNVEVKTTNCGFTPLHMAILMNNLKTVQSLLNAGSHIDAQDHLGNTPAHLAVEINSCEIFSCLVQKKANLTLENKIGECIFLSAVKHNRIKFVQIGLSSGLIDDNLVFELIDTAIKKGNTNIVDLLLERTAINPTMYHDSEENTVLHSAAMFGRPNLVKSLLNCGIEVDVKNKCSQTPLSVAATSGNKEVLKVLLNNEAQINIQDSDGFTPLHLASIHNNPKCVEILLTKGANSDIVDKNNKLAVEEAVTSGHLEVVKVFLKVNKNHLNQKGHLGSTLLHIAAQFGQATVVKFLLSEEADMNIKDESGLLPIHIAAQEDFLDIVDIFIQNGVSLNVCGRDGESILHYAVSTGKKQVVKYLLKRGSNVNFRNAEGLTPLHTAVTREYIEIAKLLLDNAAIYNVNYENTDIRIRHILSLVDKLFLAIRNGYIGDVGLSIRRGVLLNCVDSNEGSPLHFAVYKGNVKVVQLLLQNKVRTNTLHKNGWTPLHYAVKYSYYKIVLLLLWHGARYDIESDDGNKPIDLAENVQILKLLKLIRSHFEDIDEDNSNKFYGLKKLEDKDVMRAVLCAKNEHGTFLTAAVKKSFANLVLFQLIFMEHIQAKEALDYVSPREVQAANEKHLSLYQESKDMFGEDSLYTLGIKSIISTKLVNQKLYKQALTSREEVYEKLNEILGAEHKHALLERRSIAQIFSYQGNNEKSLEILKEIYEMQKKFWPLDIEESLKTLKHIAIVLLKMNKSRRSQNIFNAILKIQKKNINILIPLDVKYQIAQTYSQQGHHNEALKHLLVVYEGRKLTLGPYHLETCNILEELITILTNQKRYAEATEECGRLLKFREKHLGQYHQVTVLTQIKMADLLIKQSKYYSAYKILKAIKCANNVADAITKMLEIIVEFYADLGINGNVDNLISIIKEAIITGDAETVKKFLETGFDIAENDVEGRNSLQYAIDGNHSKIVKLLDNNADILEKTNEGNTVLHITCYKKCHDVIEMILNNAKEHES